MLKQLNQAEKDDSLVLNSSKESINVIFKKTNFSITSKNFKLFNKELSLKKVKEIISSILTRESELKRIAKDSYYHSLGFRKIVLLNTRHDGIGYKLRIHIWHPGDSKSYGTPMAEGKHEHRWDYVSRVITGTLENHQYTVKQLNKNNRKIISKFNQSISNLDKDKISDIERRLDLLEVINLKGTKSQMPKLCGGLRKLRKEVNVKELMALTGLTESELNSKVNLLFKYINERVGRGKKSVKEKYTYAGAFQLKPYPVKLIPKGKLYYGDVMRAHRLFINPTDIVSTIILTSPRAKGKMPGEFVHARTDTSGDDVRVRTPYTKNQLKKDLRWYLKHITKLQR
ncbi:hypothetical protein HY837_03745 [archaeon]|nr:hypothetical protein [archaeon]